MKRYRFTRRGRIEMQKRAMLDYGFMKNVKDRVIVPENCSIETGEIVEAALTELEAEGFVEEAKQEEGA